MCYHMKLCIFRYLISLVDIIYSEEKHTEANLGDVLLVSCRELIHMFHLPERMKTKRVSSDDQWSCHGRSAG